MKKIGFGLMGYGEWGKCHAGAMQEPEGVTLLIGHEMRFSPMYATIRKLIDSGRLGEPRYILIDLWRRPYRSGSDGWRLDPARVGNWILEEPVHYFDAAAWYLDRCGEPASVYAWGNRLQAGAGNLG